MIPPSLIAGGLFGLALVTAFGYTFYKGEKSCENSFIAKQLRAELALKDLRIKQFEEASIESKKLTDDAIKEARLQEERYEKIIQSIKDDNSPTVCVDDGFLRDLERTRKR